MNHYHYHEPPEPLSGVDGLAVTFGLCGLPFDPSLIKILEPPLFINDGTNEYLSW